MNVSTNYLIIFSLMILEGIGFPIPSEVIMPYTGYYSRTGNMDLFLGIIVGTLGSLVGSIIDYYIAFKLGLPFLKRYGKLFRLTSKRLDRLNGWFKKYGNYAVFGFRFVPEIRALISFPAGLAAMNIFNFLILTFLGHLIWDSTLAILGYIYYYQIGFLITKLEQAAYYLVGAGVIIIIAILIIALFRSRK
ncbi:DedA family protein [Sulfolobus acidocaldarius]|uniref:Conserved DedA family protein n=4 Tax=Sulfolobus acidocaldarius TaxID=2285 RepID=Q4JBX7_SULAC|nr:DedA family protein [Sulfolobus acidocaldarius]AAY79702.1 conserved DedA family protein [Sulfolobus acidocaldarius DSM 639]AGE70261.1 DedA family protein [Sulfolobus acidocaldarius N8]AGE72536.1 DedA family protein [Sulfolobus acidocaldarius Ron12/I]ALU29336.1 hypothetical protein ATY89_04850 [Sulfolobus acidocaldarius]ALU32065.1 hypothetical protein ATZ20_07875 [Sulfolobus acidocaldarius]